MFYQTIPCMTHKILLSVFFLILNCICALAQETPPPAEEEKDYFNLSLEELMNIPVSVGSKTELPIRESPAIVSVLTEQEIINLKNV